MRYLSQQNDRFKGTSATKSGIVSELISTCMWMLMSCAFCVIILVESKKLKEQKDAKEISDIFEHKNQRRMRKLNKYSINENDVQSNSDSGFQMKVKSKGKIKKMTDIPLSDYESREFSKERKYTKKKVKKISKSKVENMNSKECNELNFKRKKSKTMKNTNGSSKILSEAPPIGFRKRNIMNEELDKSSENTEKKYKFSKEKQRKQHNEEMNKISGVDKKKRTLVELSVFKREGESEKAQLDDTQKNSSYCISESLCQMQDACSDGAADSSYALEEQKHDDQFIEPKKVRYSTKFAHEKTSKKEKNKEAENIMKLHRKAESNQKNTKNMNRMNRFNDNNDESSEEVLPRRRPNLYEDDEG